MRIIQEGSVHERQATCRKCGAIVGFFHGELKWQRRLTMDENGQEYVGKFYYLNCPCCGEEIVIDIR